MKPLRYILLLLAFGCQNKDNPVETPTALEPIVPLKIGNQWFFQLSYFDTSGNVLLTTTDSFKVFRDSTIANEQWFVMSYYGGSTLVCTNRKDGFWSFERDSQYLILKYPATPNEIYPTIDATARFVSSEAVLTVPKGTFTCYKYEHAWTRLNGFKSYSYWKPGIGFVRVEIASNAGGKPYIWGALDLADYSLQ